MENVACHFVYYTGPRKGDAETFNTARITIGKSSHSDFRLDPTEDQIASDHAEILLEDGTVYRLYDLGSKAGTYVNGERVHDRCTLLPEDYIRFTQDGPEIIFRTGTPPPGKQKLPLVFPVTAELEFFSGSDAGRLFPINAAVITNLGRRAELEIPLDPRGDMIVSGNHCNIRYVDGHFVLTDSSRNGTYVNGDLVDQPMEIIDNDVIMLGDGGPQARFHVDLAKRHYPNHRPLSPTAKPEPPAQSALSAMPPSPAMPATPEIPPTPKVSDTVLASAAPFATGTASLNTPAPASQEPPADDSDIDLLDETTTESHPVPFQSDLGLPESDLPAAESTAGPSGSPSPGRRPSLAPLRSTALSLKHKLAFKPGRKLIFAAIGFVVLLGIIALFSGNDDSSASSSDRGNYTNALKKLKPHTNPETGLEISLPEGWTILDKGSMTSTESKDKQLQLDYVRDSRLNEEKIVELLSKNGAVVSPKTRTAKANDNTVLIMESTVSDISRIAAFHQAAAGPSAAAMLETTNDIRQKLTDDVVDQLLVKNVKLTASVPTPPAPATPDSSLPTPAPAPPATPDTNTPAVPSPAPTQAAAPAPGPATTATDDEESTKPEWGTKSVASTTLKVTVMVPEDWNSTIEESEGGMITLTDKTGLEIRIARDPNDLDPQGTFEAMVKDRWNKDGELPSERFNIAEFSKPDQELMLALIPEKSKSTLVLYATSAKDFTPEQRSSITNVILQVAP